MKKLFSLTALFLFLTISVGSAISKASEAMDGAKPAASEPAGDAVVMLSDEWGKRACEVWNNDDVLTGGLFESGWVNNLKDDRKYRIIEVYREDCADSPHIQLKLEPKDNKAYCLSGGVADDKWWDFLMWATTEDWTAMGNGEFGPMWGMMSGKLNFEGSMWEAMQNMGPFKNFLLMFGKVATDASKCN